jgi:hypothetical protein
VCCATLGCLWKVDEDSMIKYLTIKYAISRERMLITIKNMIALAKIRGGVPDIIPVDI